MSEYQQRDNSGSLFANKDRKAETHANARGSALIDGVAYFVDAWTKTDKNGNKWQSLSFKRKEKQAGAPKHDGPLAEQDNDIPW